jgi:hypothetical protein
MARGFESKDVEFQQAEAERHAAVKPETSAADRERASRRATIDLALANARADLTAARSPAHVRMLEAAIVELEARLRQTHDLGSDPTLASDRGQTPGRDRGGA